MRHARPPRGRSRSRRQIDPLRCTRCEACVGSCPLAAICLAPGGSVEIDPELCTGCGACLRHCREGAILRASGR